MKKLELFHEGKAKKVFKTDVKDILWICYKDDITAFNNEKHDFIKDKGVINNEISNYFFKLLDENGIENHFLKRISSRETAVRKLQIIPLEVIVRNISAGSFSKRYGIDEGKVFKNPTIEFSYKCDALGDPLINSFHILALEIITLEEIKFLEETSFKINELLKKHLLKSSIELVDFKLEFGKNEDNKIILADEISPDTCRFWDLKSHKKLDKDNYRQNLGNVSEIYLEVLNRLKIKIDQ